jgi:hypothetical protein
MNEIMKNLGAELQRRFGALVRPPMSWRMIDALVTLEEACERREEDKGDTTQMGDGGSPPASGQEMMARNDHDVARKAGQVR